MLTVFLLLRYLKEMSGTTVVFAAVGVFVGYWIWQRMSDRRRVLEIRSRLTKRDRFLARDESGLVEVLGRTETLFGRRATRFRIRNCVVRSLHPVGKTAHAAPTITCCDLRYTIEGGEGGEDRSHSILVLQGLRWPELFIEHRRPLPWRPVVATWSTQHYELHLKPGQRLPQPSAAELLDRLEYAGVGHAVEALADAVVVLPRLRGVLRDRRMTAAEIFQWLDFAEGCAAIPMTT